MWQLSESIDGMADTCRALSLPVIGGNVSLYNESGGADIDPTPVLGVLGLVDEVQAPPPGPAWADGDTVVLLGPRAAGDGSFPLEGTRWASECADHRTGLPPTVDFDAHRVVCAFVAALVAARVAGNEHSHASRGARRVGGRAGRRRGGDGRPVARRLCARGGRQAGRALHGVAFPLSGGYAHARRNCVPVP